MSDLGLVDSNGTSHRIIKATAYQPESGVWFIDADMDEAEPVSGGVNVTIGGVQFTGTVDERFAGVYAGQRRLRIVGGANGWSTDLKPKGYHNDAGVKGKLVAEDAARECGEILADYSGLERFHNDYARPAGAASLAIMGCAIESSWWVARDGRTHVGTRTSSAAKSIQVLNFDPVAKIATIACEDLTGIDVGYLLNDERLEGEQRIRELEIIADASTLRLKAWIGGQDGQGARLPRLFSSIVGHIQGQKIWGKHRYRVVSMAADGRVNAQAVRKADAIPDMILVSQWPGVAGVHAELTPGAEILVEFIGGERDEPIVTHFTPKSGGGFVPVSIVIGDKDKAAGLARMADLVTSGGPGTVVTFSLGPMAGAYTAPALALASPSGTLPVVVAGVPYLVSFSDVVSIVDDPSPPTIVPPKADPLLGYILSASDLASTQ